MDERELLKTLRVNVIMLRNALMVGQPVPIVQRMWAAAQAPKPGDLVIETSTIYWPADRSKVGTLLRVEREPVYAEGEWDEEAEGRPVPTEKVYYIRDLDGQEKRWVNADFMRIARDDIDMREMKGEPQPAMIYSPDKRRRGRI